MEKQYQPKDIESKRYAYWEQQNAFAPKGDGEPFSIVLPPPNVTGALHIGHALNHSLQDIIVRYKRMSGFRALWVPGVDHAGIATQNVVQKALLKDGSSREDLGRDKFLEKVWSWKHEYGDRITNQVRRLGASVDWNHERFTMDPESHKAVMKTFIDLYNRGYIYRGKRIINWCPKDQTALSDIEVEHKEYQGKIWSIRYDGEDGFSVIVATTRPETLFGDTAIAVHPDDVRYKDKIGKTVTVPLTNRQIPIIADDHVDPEFGTGAVKVTPAHDPNDFEIGQRHNLEQLIVMDTAAKMNANVPQAFQGLDRYVCRKKLIKDLTENGQLVEEKDHLMSRGHSYRSGEVVEPYLSNQWFVNMEKLVKPAIAAVKNGDTEIIPNRWEKLYFEWMENIRDWCISRQIWWGHQLPVWYHDSDPDTPIVQEEKPEGDGYSQDPDVLDTWFSSALWPFSTLGWPEKTDDLKTFYPTALLVTGYDILTFWVSRMMTMGFAFMDERPFGKVYVHGLVRDINGKKMSKSLGNAVDPLELVDEYGADALRYSLASMATLGGQDIKFSEDHVRASRNFANKMWNAARFILLNLEESQDAIDISDPAGFCDNLENRWILSRLSRTVKTVNQAFDAYNYAQAAEVIWEFSWNVFCDWYLEISKINKEDDLPVVCYVLVQILKLLHPFMPFVTEEIYQIFKEKVIGVDGDIITSAWPVVDENAINEKAESKLDILIDVIRECRHLRKQFDVKPVIEASAILVANDKTEAEALRDGREYILKLAKTHIDVSESSIQKPPKSIASVTGKVELFLLLDGLIDLNKEIERLTKKKEDCDKELTHVRNKLSNDGFMKNAPEAVVEKIKTKEAEVLSEKKLIEAQIAQFS